MNTESLKEKGARAQCAMMENGGIWMSREIRSEADALNVYWNIQIWREKCNICPSNDSFYDGCSNVKAKIT